MNDWRLKSNKLINTHKTQSNSMEASNHYKNRIREPKHARELDQYTRELESWHEVIYVAKGKSSTRKVLDTKSSYQRSIKEIKNFSFIPSKLFIVLFLSFYPTNKIIMMTHTYKI